ncbi:MAG: hypothetical protein ACRD16_14785 [Thermoanaerobaculia bacterium]
MNSAADLASGDSAAARRGAWLLNDDLDLAAFAVVAVEVALAAFLIRQYHLFNPAFYQLVLPLACAGFVIQHLSPSSWRLPIFLIASLAAILLVVGWQDALVITAVGAILLALFHAPIRVWQRLAALSAMGAAFAWLRTSSRFPALGALWPILGSMFVFRAVVYFHDVRHAKTRPTLLEGAAYLFLLPNVCFPLFPVVDLSALRRGRAGAPRVFVYHRGALFMIRGALLVLLYRIVYYRIVVRADSVATAGQLLVYMVGNFLLILSMIGQFDLIVGMIHLFGFNLPAINRQNFLSRSFTDFWRRNNIYWRDFMQKVAYYPVYFGLRRWGTTLALAAACVVVFVATWLLHAIQWFWILGNFPVSVPDVLFWGLFGLIFTFSALRDDRRSRLKKSPGSPLRRALATIGGTVGTFMAVTVLWCLWTSPSLAAFLHLLGAARVPGIDFAIFVRLLVVLAAVLAVSAISFEAKPLGSRPAMYRSAAIAAVVMASVLFPVIRVRFFGARNLPRIVGDLQSSRLNESDEADLTRGYYEQLKSVARVNTRLWELYMRGKSSGWNAYQDRIRATGDLAGYTPIPSARLRAKSVLYTTNRWGMHDRDYTRAAPPGTCRIALFGGSQVEGAGIPDGETFENLAEDEMNRRAPIGRCAQFELLNFAAPDYRPINSLGVLLNRGLAFSPDVALLFTVPDLDRQKSPERLAEIVQHHGDLQFEFVRRIVAGAGLNGDGSFKESLARLRPFADEIYRDSIREFSELARSHGIVPALSYLNLPSRPFAQQHNAVEWLAREFHDDFLELGNPFHGRDPSDFFLTEWDHHPNRKAQPLIARHLVDATLASVGEFGFLRPDAGGKVQK